MSHTIRKTMAYQYEASVLQHSQNEGLPVSACMGSCPTPIKKYGAPVDLCPTLVRDPGKLKLS